MRVPLAAKRRSSRGGNRAYFTLQRHELLPASDPQKQVFLSKVLAENETGTGLDDAAIVREAKALIVAGTDTTAITATYLVWAILRHPAVKARLQEEIGTLPAGFSAVEVQKLRYLQLVIQETLRLYGAVSGGLPRTVPAGGRQLGGYFVPEDCVVTTQAFTLHRNPGVFPQPLKCVTTVSLPGSPCSVRLILLDSSLSAGMRPRRL
jgi:cytochrome P450